MVSMLRKIYQSVVMFQIFLFLFFVIENVNNLDNVVFYIIIDGETSETVINFYVILLILAGLFVIIILAGINLFGTGLNEEGTRNVAKYLSLIGMLSLITITGAYYLLQFGILGLLIEMIFALIYLFYVFESIQASPSMEV